MSSGVRPPVCAPSESGNMAIATGKTSRHISALFRGVIPTLPLLRSGDYIRGILRARGTARSVGCITTLPAISLLDQQPPTTIRTRTTLVPVDVRVVDLHEDPAPDLERDDFTIEARIGAVSARRDLRFTVRQDHRRSP